MKRYSLFVTAIATLVTCSWAVAGEIYKWTDSEGSVHYEDRPIGDPPMEHLSVRSRNTDNSAVQRRVAARREARATAEQVASEAPPEMSKAELRAEKEKRQQQCQTYRARLARFLSARTLYREDATGERNYLDADEIQAARERVEGQIKEYCG